MVLRILQFLLILAVIRALREMPARMEGAMILGHG
jgi:hypothetical protein